VSTVASMNPPTARPAFVHPRPAIGAERLLAEGQQDPPRPRGCRASAVGGDHHRRSPPGRRRQHRAHPQPHEADRGRILQAAFDLGGTPDPLLTDRGPPFARPDDGPRIITPWLAARGVPRINASPQHPETLGKQERWHGSIPDDWIAWTEPVDTGFIVFNDRNYPNFRGFLDELDVSSEPTEMSFSFRDESSGLEYGGHGLGAFFSQWKNLVSPEHWGMLIDIIRFNRKAPSDREDIEDGTTLEEYLNSRSYGSSFVRNHLVPMVSAIWSVSLETALSFPFRYVIDFFENHGLLNIRDRPQWRTIPGGSRKYLKAFHDAFSGTIRTNDPVRVVERNTGEVSIQSERTEKKYEAVVLATHSNQALELLRCPDETDQAVLGRISYKKNRALLHTDTSLLPKDPSVWASWNYHRGAGSHMDPTVTYNMNILQHLTLDRTVCVSLNSQERIASEHVIDEFTYAHPVYDQSALCAQDRKDEISGTGNVYYAGAYWGNGFHEDGVVSAMDVARRLGVEWSP